MADNAPSAFLKLGYCKSVDGGDWDGSFKEWESDSQHDYAVLEDSHYKNTKGLHVVMFWRGSQAVAEGGNKPPDELKSNGPGVTSLGLDGELTPVGKLYEAYVGMNKGVLVNWKIVLFRDRYPASQKKTNAHHHWFSVTGIAGRILSIDHGADGLGLVLAANRMSWYDHDRKQGGKTGWEDHTGKNLRAMPTSPL